LHDIHRDGGELNSGNPRLVVKISPGNYGEFLGPPSEIFATALLAGIGLLLIGSAFLVNWIRRRRADRRSR
jgi:hypothetical protein